MNDRPFRIQYAPSERIYQHADVLEDFMRRICELEPHEYALSDESLLTDMDFVDEDRVFTAVREIYGIDVPRGRDQPCLWQIIEQIVAARRVH